MGSVFPAYVGMSPTKTWKSGMLLCVPRIRGDEPIVLGLWHHRALCSPHTWG